MRNIRNPQDAYNLCLWIRAQLGHLAPYTLDNAATILCSQTSNVNLINAILLLVHFLIMFNILCLFYAYVYVFYDLTFCLCVLLSF